MSEKTWYILVPDLTFFQTFDSTRFHSQSVEHVYGVCVYYTLNNICKQSSTEKLYTGGNERCSNRLPKPTFSCSFVTKPASHSHSVSKCIFSIHEFDLSPTTSFDFLLLTNLNNTLPCLSHDPSYQCVYYSFHMFCTAYNVNETDTTRIDSRIL